MSLKLSVLFLFFYSFSSFAELEQYPFFDAKKISKTCIDSIRNFEIELKLLKNECEKTVECDAYFLRPHRCAYPVILPKKETDIKKLTKSLTRYNQLILDGCRQDWDKGKKCEIPSFVPACKKNKCVNSLQK